MPKQLGNQNNKSLLQ